MYFAKLKDIIDDILGYAQKEPSLKNGTVKEGDVYRVLNSEEYPDVSFAAFVLTFTEANIDFDEGFVTFNFCATYCDRLLEDEINRLQIQCMGCGVLYNIISYINENYICSSAELTPFTEKFNDMTSGVFTYFKITVPISLCWDDYNDI